jgi:uncharacterized spore protein YtfJ
MSIPEAFQSFVGSLQQSAHVKSVFGEPITAEGKTLIPVAKVGYGYGGSHPNAEGVSPENAMRRAGFGGGVGAKPLGVIEVTRETTRFVPLGIGRHLLKALAVGLALGFLIGRRR